MLNESCIKTVMFYLNDHLKYKRNGKVFPIKARTIIDELSATYSADEILQAISYLVQMGLISRTNQENKNVAPGVFNINGITPAGYQFLSLAKNDTLWEKLREKLTLEKIFDLISTGINAAQLLQNFL